MGVRWDSGAVELRLEANKELIAVAGIDAPMRSAVHVLLSMVMAASLAGAGADA